MSRFGAIARLMLAGAGILLAGRLSAADPLAEIVRMHVEVVGGRARIQALHAIQARGIVQLEQARVNVVLTVARPNRLRLEAESEGRKFLQAYDGVDVPWQIDPGDWPVRYRLVSEPSATRLMADAEFDGPLIAAKERGFVLRYGGEVEREGRKYLRVEVNWKFRDTFSLLLDPETYLIACRIDARPLAEDRVEETVTYYGDYRPVDGVLVPHEVITAVDGRITDRMQLDIIEPNPAVSSEMFTRPDRPEGPPVIR